MTLKHTFIDSYFVDFVDFVDIYMNFIHQCDKIITHTAIHTAHKYPLFRNQVIQSKNCVVILGRKL